eukprot:Blabericola_migrator_1__9163@NODE_48_length_16467_cov_53_390427_g44_i0_p6_GENE_NODE_48_length_16467_cov_53_390427_g44_i0NODE_48_length_16467_cov_53_390427_g44_i0_p6_ORF_typecomplete_len325_score51_12Integrin_beta/PF00362_18/1e11VWA_2/PF13519_6/7_7e05VWA/PF00092_28/0_025IMUP/PF15761_5/0_83_NODE_48_length_16467_cov_53_390427_g44_i01458015554
MMRALGFLASLSLAVLADDTSDTTNCTLYRDPEVMILQDYTGSFMNLVDSTTASMPAFAQKLFDKYPESRVGYAAFGDKAYSPETRTNLQCFRWSQPLTNDVETFKTSVTSFDKSSILCDGEPSENGLESACYVAGPGSGFTEYTGAADDTKTRFIVLITDAPGKWGGDSTGRWAVYSQPNLVNDGPNCDISKGYAPLEEISTCLHDRGINLLVLVTDEDVAWWQTNLPELGYNETNSAAVQIDALKGTDKYVEDLFALINDQIQVVGCKQQELLPTVVPTVSTEATVAATEATSTSSSSSSSSSSVEAVDTDGLIDCCTYCLD